MISKDQRAKIRRLFFAEHWKIGTIAAQMGLHATTVARALESDRFAPQTRPVRPVLLDPYKPFIADVLTKYPRLRATRLYQMIQQRGYPGSLIQLRRYIKTVRPSDNKEAYLRLETLPGEQGQVDWGHFGKLTVGAAVRPLSCFVLVLSFSRAMFARFFLDQRMESFLRGHVEAFEALGGVPRALLYDNLKSVVIERDGDLIRFHPQILELAGHYHFDPKPCAPYRGNEKGKVERTIQYIRHSFFAARKFDSVAQLNAQMRRWIDEVAHVRPVPRHPQRLPVAEALDQERPRLLPLPQNAYSTEHVTPVRSGKTPYVRFDKNDYSIPHTLVRQSLTVVASESRVRIVDSAHQVVADHPRSYDCKQRIEDFAHLRELARTKHRAHASTGRQRLMLACPHAAPFFAELSTRNELMRVHTVRLGRLLDAYGRAELDAALALALKRGAVSAASVAHILDRRRRAKDQLPPLPPVLPDDPRARAVHVTPHALDPYDDLATERAGDGDEPRSDDSSGERADADPAAEPQTEATTGDDHVQR